MTDEWFDEYMFRVVVNKKYCPQNVLDMLKQKPVRLPAWIPCSKMNNNIHTNPIIRQRK